MLLHVVTPMLWIKYQMFTVTGDRWRGITTAGSKAKLYLAFVNVEHADSCMQISTDVAEFNHFACRYTTNQKALSIIAQSVNLTDFYFQKNQYGVSIQAKNVTLERSRFEDIVSGNALTLNSYHSLLNYCNFANVSSGNALVFSGGTDSILNIQNNHFERIQKRFQDDSSIFFSGDTLSVTSTNFYSIFRVLHIKSLRKSLLFSFNEVQNCTSVAVFIDTSSILNNFDATSNSLHYLKAGFFYWQPSNVCNKQQQSMTITDNKYTESNGLFLDYSRTAYYAYCDEIYWRVQGNNFVSNNQTLIEISISENIQNFTFEFS